VRGLGSCEELVHDLGARGDDRPQFPAVDDLGCPGGGVSDEAGDLVDLMKIHNPGGLART
jgi:hypothetical protein